MKDNLKSANAWKWTACGAALATAAAWVVPFGLSLVLGRPAAPEVYGPLIYLWPAPFLIGATLTVVALLGWMAALVRLGAR
jgi:hypothetical protein